MSLANSLKHVIVGKEKKYFQNYIYGIENSSLLILRIFRAAFRRKILTFFLIHLFIYILLIVEIQYQIRSSVSLNFENLFSAKATKWKWISNSWKYHIQIKISVVIFKTNFS